MNFFVIASAADCLTARPERVEGYTGLRQAQPERAFHVHCSRPNVWKAMARLAAGLALFYWGGLSSWALAQTTPVAEYAIKSALLFKLPQFIYRPDPAREQALVICLLGNNPFGGAPEKLALAPIDGRTVKFQKLSSTAEARNCELIFIARSETGNLEAVLRQLSGLTIVTVSDIDGFAKSGGMVEFSLGGEGAAVSILINRKAAQRQNMEFNAQLLRLAKAIDP